MDALDGWKGKSFSLRAPPWLHEPRSTAALRTLIDFLREPATATARPGHVAL